MKSREELIKEIENLRVQADKDFCNLAALYKTCTNIPSYEKYKMDCAMGKAIAYQNVLDMLDVEPEERDEPIPPRFLEFEKGVLLDAKRIDYIWQQWGALYILIGGVEKCLVAKSSDIQQKYEQLIKWWKYWNEN